MGQGYSITTLSAGSAGIDAPEMADLTYEKSLSSARFMKTIRARHQEGLVVVKVVMKAYSSFELDKYVKALIAERNTLVDIPNVLAYHRIVETSTNGYLVRQYMHGSLYDRLSTRPFLEDIEKKWIAFQLICAVRDCHARNIFHGDIKTENVLVTSWNWVYLADFSASFKPTYLPEDNPADFSFFFDISGRRTCYLAPERFLSTGEDPTTKAEMNWSMDVFSLGCVIAELFLETPIFTLSQLFKYRARGRDYDPRQTHLKRIADPEIRDMVAHMISVDPQSRYRAEDYLTFYKDKAFPGYFYNFLHQYMHLMTDPSSGRSPLTRGKENLGESDDRINRLYNDFEKIRFFLGYDHAQDDPKLVGRGLASDNQLMPLEVDIAGDKHVAAVVKKRPFDDGTLLFLTIVVGCLKTTARSRARVKACDLLLAFAEQLTDEAKLDRILPYLMSMLHDKSDLVKVAAIRTITQILALVKVVSPTNSYIFPEYILPRFQFILAIVDKQSQADKEEALQKQPSAWVRATYAMCLGSLATTAAKFLDMNQALNAKGGLSGADTETEEGTINRSAYQSLFDNAREDILAQFEAHAIALLTDKDASVRRSLLPSVSTLCVFFGSQKASDVILSHLNTYLNDRDWKLKIAFFETIVGVAIYVGTAGLEEFILPLMIQALTDPEELVVERVMRSLSSIAELGLFSRPILWELLDIVARFTMHPNQWIREAAAQYIAATCRHASKGDQYGVINPTIRSYLRVVPHDMDVISVLGALTKPLSRIILDLSLAWAKKSDKTQFWKPSQKQRMFQFAFGDNLRFSSREPPKQLQRLPKTEEDAQWIQRLRNAGLDLSDDFKLLALQEYIWRSAHRILNSDAQASANKFNGIVKMNDLNVELQNVFFDNDKAAVQAANYDMRTRTIAEAMQDATSSLMAPPQSKKDEPESPSGPKDIPSSSTKGLVALHAMTHNHESSSFDSRRSFRLADHVVERKGSVMSLMGRKDTATKAAAELSTDVTNAFGKLERTHSQEHIRTSTATSPTAISNGRLDVGGRKILPVHSYPGNDPNVLHLLDSLYLESYPVDLIEFGPMVTPVRNDSLKRRGSSASPWRPDAVLVAMLCEHTAAITRVVAAPDHRFFLTGSDDGTVKVWDTGRLERNVTHRSRHTHQQGAKAKITSLCFIEDTHCFVSTGSDGSAHVVKVESSEQSSNSMTRYGRIIVVRDYQLPADEFAVWCHHLKVDNHSILILATNKSRVYGIELRTMKVLYTLQNPLYHGTPTCFCVDRKHHWLLLGTSQGVLDLWDLRFKLRLRSWGFQDGGPIHRLHNQSFRGSRRYKVIVCGGIAGEIVAFDIEKAQVKDLYKTSIATGREGALKNASPIPVILDLEDESNRAGGVLSRFVGSSAMTAAQASSDKGVRAVAIVPQGAPESSEAKNIFLLSAGPDWKVRFWDSARPDSCMVVSGLEYDEAQPAYSRREYNGISIISEKAAASTLATDEASSSKTTTTTTTTPAVAASPRKSKSSRHSIVSMQQQALLRGHKDVIMDLALLESPYGMIVSVDRGGVVYVYS